MCVVTSLAIYLLPLILFLLAIFDFLICHVSRETAARSRLSFAKSTCVLLPFLKHDANASQSLIVVSLFLVIF